MDKRSQAVVDHGLFERGERHSGKGNLFDSRVHDRWSFELLLMVQRKMNTVEKTSTGVTPAQLILNNSIRLSNQSKCCSRTGCYTPLPVTHSSGV